ncbi:MAG: hypothetical protein ACREQP_03895 [Candidatus Binatia bacterium]
MYNDYFGFREAPFNVTPNPKYFFYSNPTYQEAYANLLYEYGSERDLSFLPERSEPEKRRFAAHRICYVGKKISGDMIREAAVNLQLDDIDRRMGDGGSFAAKTITKDGKNEDRKRSNAGEEQAAGRLRNIKPVLVGSCAASILLAFLIGRVFSYQPYFYAWFSDVVFSPVESGKNPSYRLAEDFRALDGRCRGWEISWRQRNRTGICRTGRSSHIFKQRSLGSTESATLIGRLLGSIHGGNGGHFG